MNVADVPKGSRPSARVLVLDPQDRLLLLHAREAEVSRRWWIAPGGGVGKDETFEIAARREVLEETGLTAEIGPWVWTRRHIYLWNGQRHDQYERYFVSRVDQRDVAPLRPDAYVTGFRWWTCQEIQNSTEDFAPRRLAELLPALIAGRYPEMPIDSGV